MRILFCIKAMNVPGGGAERVLADVASGLAGRGHQMSLLTFDPPGGSSYYPLHEAVHRVELGLGSTTDRAGLLITLRRIRALRSRAVRLRPEVAVGFMHSMYIPLGLALAGSRIPLIASEHTVPHHYRTRPIQAALLRLTPLVARRITCVSPQALAMFPRNFRRKAVVAPNPVTMRVSGRADAVGPPPPARRILLAVGSLEPLKDHETLLRAFASLAGRFPFWDLRIVGEGGLRPRLEALAARLGLSQRVQMPGAAQDIGPEYAAAQLFVIPSRYESFGLTTAEALAHGLPAVGLADCPGSNQLIRPGVNGLLARGGEDRTAALAGCLADLMGDDARRAGLAPPPRGLPSEHDLENVLDRWEEIIGATAGA